MDERTMAIKEFFEKNQLGMEDIFQFKCNSCGKCCKNREDIILPPYDLFKIAQHLHMSAEAVVEKYGEWYIGSNSRIPIVRIKPAGAGKRCPFLEGKLCRIHEAKPSVCGLYPLGRAIKYDRDDERNDKLEIAYFRQPHDCSVKKSQTVSEWLERFDLKKTEPLFIRWSEFLKIATPIISDLEKSLEPYAALILSSSLYKRLYLEFEDDRPFEDQFLKNTNIAKAGLQRLANMTSVLSNDPESTMLQILGAMAVAYE